MSAWVDRHDARQTFPRVFQAPGGIATPILARNKLIALSDRRELEFDADALVAVISTSSRAAQAFGLPGLQPTGVRFFPSDGRIDVMYGTGQTQKSVPLGAEPLGALLVSYCIRVRIPMPRNADKGIRIEADAAILAFRTTYAKAPAPEGQDNTTGTPAAVRAWTWVEPKAVERSR